MKTQKKSKPKKAKVVPHPCVKEYEKHYLQTQTDWIGRLGVKFNLIQLRFVKNDYFVTKYDEEPYKVFYRINPYNPLSYPFLLSGILWLGFTFKLDYANFFSNIKTVFTYQQD
jgi:hypothetical protein